MENIDYKKKAPYCYKASSKEGFLASLKIFQIIKGFGLRDGVICGLAALASGDKKID
jgi:hypothetical protein